MNDKVCVLCSISLKFSEYPVNYNAHSFQMGSGQGPLDLHNLQHYILDSLHQINVQTYQHLNYAN